jgi:Tfp pilus assembly protein PilN
VRSVNLLPQKHRPHQPNGARSGSAYMVIGVLGLFLAALVAYVLQVNSITQAKNDIAVAQQRTAEARAKSQQLGPFGNFAQIKQQRVASVRQLAEGRFDWERTVRELALVLPDGVWLRDFTGTVAPGAASASNTAAAPTDWAGPSIQLHGCAQEQPQIADMIVRLREMKGVKDVVLKDSIRANDPQKNQSAATQGDSAQPSDDCGSKNGHGNYEFHARVDFQPAQPSASEKPGETPVRLGGGA